MDTNLDKGFSLFELRESDLDPNPFDQFEKWFNDALKALNYMG